MYYHRLNSPTSADSLLFGKKFHDDTFGPMDLISCGVTENGRYLLISVAHGVPAKRVDLYAKDLRQPDSPIRTMVHGIDNEFYPINYEDSLYISTDYQAPNYRVVRVDMNDPDPSKWTTIVPEGKDVISYALL